MTWELIVHMHQCAFSHLARAPVMQSNNAFVVLAIIINGMFKINSGNTHSRERTVYIIGDL